MLHIIVLSHTARSCADVLPALDLLPHSNQIAALDPTVLTSTIQSAVLLLDARQDLIAARTTARWLHAAETQHPVIAIVTEGGLVGVTPDWPLTDLMVHTASPAEVEARLQRAHHQHQPTAPQDSGTIAVDDLSIDASGYTAKLRGQPLDLTYKEFELLKYLAQHPGRVFTRSHLLQEVWGFDYYGGTRTVDVHVRRLRAKLGPDHDVFIGTVRNVGYRFDAASPQ